MVKSVMIGKDVEIRGLREQIALAQKQLDLTENFVKQNKEASEDTIEQR